MVKGIDVSKYQPSVDWKQVKSAGYEWAIVRAGLQGYSKGAFQTDPYFKRHIEGALTAGLPVGVYWFDQAISVGEAEAAADYCCELVKPYPIKLGVWWDNEQTQVYPHGRADKLSNEMRTSIGEIFLARVAERGYLGGVYTNPNYLTYKLDAARLSKYPLWLAHYGVAQPSRPCAIWQHGKGRVPGISTECDLNVMYDAGMMGPSASTAPKLPYAATVSASILNVRSGPGVTARKIGALRNGQIVTVKAVSGDWGRIEFGPGVVGWISLKYVRL